VTIGPAPIEGVERTKAVMVHPQQRVGFAQRNTYAMEVDRNNRNCYACGVLDTWQDTVGIEEQV